jgi:hypothetical protein
MTLKELLSKVETLEELEEILPQFMSFRAYGREYRKDRQGKKVDQKENEVKI